MAPNFSGSVLRGGSEIVAYTIGDRLADDMFMVLSCVCYKKAPEKLHCVKKNGQVKKTLAELIPVFNGGHSISSRIC